MIKNKFTINIKDYKLALILFLLTAFLILFFLPRTGKFQYEFQKGKPWNHEDLSAPFDFPIYKTQAELSEEQKLINDYYNVYFVYDPSIQELQISLLNNTLPDSLKWRNLKNEIINLFQEVYTRGILNNRNDIQDRSIISIIRGNISEDYLVAELFTVSSAQQYLTSSLSNLAEQDELALFLQYIDLRQFIQANLYFDEQLTQQVLENRLESILPTQGMVLKGDRIISRGEVVTSTNFQILSSLKKEYEENMGFSGSRVLLVLGQFLFILICLAALFVLLLLFNPVLLSNNKNLIFLLILINIISIAALLIIKYNESFIYFVPFTIVPIYITTFFTSRPGLFVHWMLILLVGNFAPNGFEFVFLNSIAAVIAVWSFNHLYKRGQLFSAVFFIFLTYSLSYLVLKLIQEGSFSTINWFFLLIFSINCILIITLYQFTFIFEKLFGFLSDSRLIELADTNQKLLRELAEVAPGTFQHSLQVANLAEAAIREIGGNVLLVRAGALYHDIGKMKNPGFFIENQSSDFNPHCRLTPEESARIIIEHVSYGVELAHKYNLPKAIIDFINSHHGKSKVRYFFTQYMNEHPEADEKEIAPLFTYKGFNPTSKEMAVVMIADSSEAASRSLKIYTSDEITKLVSNIITYQLNEGLYNNANITMEEISIIKSVIIDKLKNIYHGRIEYPEMEKKQQ